MSPTPRRSLRLAGKEPELTTNMAASSYVKSSRHESVTERKGMSFHLPRMDNCLLFGNFLAAALSTVATVAATYTWKQS